MPPRPLLPPGRLAAVAGACVVLAALSLLAPHAPTYDPWAWLTWGRQIASGELDTIAGPSWKPLPVAFTALFALLDAARAPDLWLVVARAAGLASIALAFVLTRRLAGPVAGVLAAVALVLLNGYLAGFARGNSEALLVLLWLVALAWHLEGRPRRAFAAAALSALLRPEVWAFVALHGLWLLAHERRDGVPLRALAAVAGAGIAVALLWFVPEYVGSGSPLRGASRAQEVVPGSPATSPVPFVAVFANAWQVLPAPAYAAALAAVALALPRRRASATAAAVAGIGALTAAYMVVVGVFAQIGFTGNLRYITLPAALVCVLAGVGGAELVRVVGDRRGARAARLAGAIALAAAAPFAVVAAGARAEQLGDVEAQAREARELPAVIARAGGREALVGCPQVFTTPFEVQLVAWHLRVASRRVGIHPDPPGTTILLDHREEAEPVDPRFARVAAGEHWIVRSTCVSGRG